MYHVFVVNDETFKLHLEYLFAGTGSGVKPIGLYNIWYNKPKSRDSFVGMVADVSRIRKGDKILFYLTQNTKKNKHEGMFFGVFDVTQEAFFDKQGTYPKMPKKLYFRIRIKPYKVFPFGVTEREALDNLSGILHPSEMCWSLIYRKLRANRGCTMITDNEATRLVKLLKQKNKNKILTASSFSYDENKCEIVSSKKQDKYTVTKKSSVDIVPRLIAKAQMKSSYEAHLQTYVLQHIDEKVFCDLLEIDRKIPRWLGNEVSCGVGMQSIDIMTLQETKRSVRINVIELKDENPKEEIKYQLAKYVEWLQYYIAPLYKNKQVRIMPVIMAKCFAYKSAQKDFVFECKKMSFPVLSKNVKIQPVLYLGYKIENNNINFLDVATELAA